MRQMTFCEECGKRGGTIPKYYWDGVVAMLHESCAMAQMERYMNRRKEEAS